MYCGVERVDGCSSARAREVHNISYLQPFVILKFENTNLNILKLITRTLIHCCTVHMVFKCFIYLPETADVKMSQGTRFNQMAHFHEMNTSTLSMFVNRTHTLSPSKASPSAPITVQSGCGPEGEVLDIPGWFREGSGEVSQCRGEGVFYCPALTFSPRARPTPSSPFPPPPRWAQAPTTDQQSVEKKQTCSLHYHTGTTRLCAEASRGLVTKKKLKQTKSSFKTYRIADCISTASWTWLSWWR